MVEGMFTRKLKRRRMNRRSENKDAHRISFIFIIYSVNVYIYKKEVNDRYL